MPQQVISKSNQNGESPARHLIETQQEELIDQRVKG